MLPKVSVLMCTFQEPSDWINSSINSILNQTFADFEFIIINDNPQSQELKLQLDKFQKQDKRIEIIENLNNLGLADSLNKGINYCKGEYIARMDADDISFPKRLEKQYNFMNDNSKIGVCGTFGQAFGKKNKKIIMPISHNEIRDTILERSPFIHPSVFLRKKILMDNNIRYKRLKLAQDYNLWVDLVNKTFFYNIPEILIKYRFSNLQITNNNIDRIFIAWRIKKEAIQQVYGDDVKNFIFEQDTITLKTISEIKTILPDNLTKKAINTLIENLYLSLSKYNIKSALSYLLKENCPKTKIFAKLLKRSFEHNYYYNRINIEIN